jgi:hypothetical protein
MNCLVTILTPCAILVTALPGDGDDGFIDISGSGIRVLLVVMCGLLVALLIGAAAILHSDHGLLFGAATIFTTLTEVVAFVSVFVRKHVEGQAGRTFVLLAAVTVILFVLAAHDCCSRP